MVTREEFNQRFTQAEFDALPRATLADVQAREVVLNGGCVAPLGDCECAKPEAGDVVKIVNRDAPARESVTDPETGETVNQVKDCHCGEMVWDCTVALRPVQYCRTAINAVKLHHSQVAHPQNGDPEVCWEIHQRYDDDGFLLSTYRRNWKISDAETRTAAGLVKLHPDGRIIDASIALKQSSGL